MRGIDFRRLKAEIEMTEVLKILDYVPTRRTGGQLRGPCPIHGSTSSRSRAFSVNLQRNAFHCFKCGARGNQLDLWAAVTDLAVYDAAIDLCERLGVEIPFIEPRAPDASGVAR